MKRVHPGVQEEFATQLALGLHDGFNLAELLGNFHKAALSFRCSVFEIHARHTAQYQCAHRFTDAILIAVASFTVSIERHAHRASKAAADLNEAIAAHDLAVGIAQRRGDPAAGTLDRFEAHLFEQQSAQHIVGTRHDKNLRRAYQFSESAALLIGSSNYRIRHRFHDDLQEI